MKKYARIIALLLAVITVLAMAVSCAEGSGEDDTSAQAVNTEGTPEETTASIYDADGYLLDNLPDNLNYNGETVKILYWSDCEREEFEITEDELSGNIVNDAIFKRNANTEERLGVKFEWYSTKGNNSNIQNFTNYVTNLYSSGGDDLVDLIGTYSRSAATCSTAGLLYDINKISNSYIDFDMPWWPKTCYDTCTIGNSLYFCSGDISTNVLHFMYCIYYNMDMLKDYAELEDPIKLVDDKKWTIDKLIEMTASIYVDSDNSGTCNYEDTYGFCSIYYGLDAFYTGSGLRLVDDDADNLLVISEDYTSQKAVDLVDKLGTWLTSDTCFIDGGNKSMDSHSNYYPFVQGKCLFCQNRVYLADSQSSSKLNEVEWNYGILPTPLYDENQDDYMTVVGNPFSLWCVMAGIDSHAAERATAVMECMASEGYRTTTPALFETNMKYRYTVGADNDGVRMFDIVHDGIDFDLGRIYSYPLNYMSESPSKAAATAGSWATQSKSLVKVLKSNIKTKVVEPLRKLEE